MIEIILVVHLILAISIVVLVLLQRSEGGALGIGGSGNIGGMMSGRTAGNILTKATAGLAAGFMATSLTLTILAGQSGERRSLVEDIQDTPTTNQPLKPPGPQVPTSN